MIQSVFLIGAILTVAIVVINIVLLKASPKEKYTCYYPSFVFIIAGLLFLGLASLMDKVEVMGAGLGGWGIASLFAAAIGLIVTSILDSNANNANA
ncbi:hypothetical protein CIL05_04315 [Virgibacillus profundi]|uniref:Uncharacterized protein n=1 Tax=Virgibacillus profundi TaxID=2024555 RepID=A0A2A2IIM3_9BACI|nr:hypothetical protein [Virgibacillus profundi]PAV30945.1 hypothetical protein CIL05_04315 [Virgibacillus profundi]PXY55130.1 hypothetical protein CIT14_04400 [Virgibacillus profundi]